MHEQLHASPPCAPVQDAQSLTGWVCVGKRQLSGMLLLVFSRLPMREHITNVTTGIVGCGVGGFGGNKGAAAVCMALFRQRVLLLTSHLAAHQVRLTHAQHACLHASRWRECVESARASTGLSMHVRCVAW
jgi:hypothetical protein